MLCLARSGDLRREFYTVGRDVVAMFIAICQLTHFRVTSLPRRRCTCLIITSTSAVRRRRRRGMLVNTSLSHIGGCARIDSYYVGRIAYLC